MRKLTCPCEQVFNFDFPDVVNLDSTPEIIGNILNGSFLTCVCPACNAELHTDLKTRFEWPSKKINLVLIPEIDRFAFISGKVTEETDAQIVIGFAELSDRIAVLVAGLDPLIIEAIKYHLIVKARETNPEAKLIVLFEKIDASKNLEFHIHGLKTDEVALTHIPFRIYETIQKEATDHSEKEPYQSLRNGAYLSVQNILLEDLSND